MDTATVVYPQPQTSPLPFTGVVGGAPVLSQPSSSYPVVKCQVNIALPDGSGQGVEDGRIVRQKGVRKFMVVSRRPWGINNNMIRNLRSTYKKDNNILLED